MTIKVAHIGISILALGSFALAGCGDKDDAKSTDMTTTTSATKTTMMESDDSTTTTEMSSSVGPAGGVKLGNGEAPASRTITVSSQALTPNTLTIKVGENVTFKDAASGIYGIIVGDLDGATVHGGLYETFDFSKPGTYAVKEELTENTATIIVE